MITCHFHEIPYSDKLLIIKYLGFDIRYLPSVLKPIGKILMNTPNSYKPHQQSNNKQWLIAALLLAILVLTRGGFVAHIQDASWAVFFLVGFYLRNYLGLPILMLSAIAIDFAVIAARGGHQDYYLTPSYLFIIPAYSALWFAGRYVANKYSESLKGLLTFVAAAVVGIVACDLISSAGFYWMSAPVGELSISDFISRIVEFTPLSLKSTMLYLSIAAVTHMAFIQARKFTSSEQTHSS